ncbi:PAS domain S-box protein [Desertivirga brevis]|uniref:PAS domain S-box protein n=1 Tax=Desertivirga brevis TaxID=2810310 RepID=UPI001A970470|nr:PAS domain S-box protein [Pedobacter sp. SYSU D00873]
MIFAKGEMADRIKENDWSGTALGSIDQWPTPLITSVNIMLDSRFPMFIWWGQDKIQLYNDAYKDILGGANGSKHPDALGQKGEDCWPEVWSVISPMIEGVLETGNSVYLEDQLIPIYRNGKLDNIYWTFSYSPIRGNDGRPEGILVVCTETTRNNQLIQENEQQLQRVFDHMAEGVGITDTTGKIIYSNPMAHQILSTDSARFPERRSNSPEWYNVHLDGRPMADDEHPTMVAMATGKPVFNFEFAIERPGSSRMYLTMNAAPITDAEGNVTGSVGMFTDITERKQTEVALQATKDALEKQKQLYEAITSGTPDLMYVLDLDYKFIYANKALLNMWGKTWETAVGKGLRENGYEEWHAKMHEREIDQVRITKKPIRGEVSFPHATLGRRIYDYILTPLFDESGEVIAVPGTTRDITDIKNAEAAIAESEERFRTMAESSGILIGVGDETSNVTYFNQAWSKLTGKTTEELLAYGWSELIHPEDKDAYLNLYLDAVKNQAPYTGEYRILSASGEYRWLYAFATPRFKPDGSFAGFIGSFIDITERKEDEQRKNDFISMVSHELKTPLTSLSSYIQILERRARQRGDDLAVGMLGKATKQAGKMKTLINGFLNVSRLESSKIHIEPQLFDLAGLLKDIEEEIMAQVDTHHIVFAPVEETLVNADKDKIGQVITNLISNAVKYSPFESAIKIACVTKQGKAIISVQDEGMGINQEDLPKLFERYYRAKNTSNGNIAGFGIGLYLCCEIVKRHQGEIWAESELGKGSTFYFELPIHTNNQ